MMGYIRFPIDALLELTQI